MGRRADDLAPLIAISFFFQLTELFVSLGGGERTLAKPPDRAAPPGGTSPFQIEVSRLRTLSRSRVELERQAWPPIFCPTVTI